MGVRFLPDKRLRLEDGSTLDGGPWMSHADARPAAAASRVLLHSYPAVEDITEDTARVQRLLELVQTRPRVEKYSAQLYTS